MCTTEPNYDYCGVDLMQTGESSDDSFAPAARVVTAPSLNAVLKGTLAPVENLLDIEHGIWNPDDPERFLSASLQFLENKLHSRIFQMAPTSSGKIVLSDGFIFSPIYPTTPRDSQTTWEECVSKVHNFSEDEGVYAWKDPKRVRSVAYSCISLPGEYGMASTRDEHVPNRLAVDDVPWGSQREIGIQTSTELFTPLTEMSSSMVSEEETQPICNFSEYVQYCHSIVRPPSQLFNFGKPTQEKVTDYKTNDEMTELRYDSTAEYPFQPIRKEKESLPNSARTYASHYRSPSKNQEKGSTVRDKIPPHEASAIRRSPGPSSKLTTSTTTVSSAKSYLSNRTEHSVYRKHHREGASSTASTKSVYYYARISASFFSFLNRATQKNKIEKNSRPSSTVPAVSSATQSIVSAAPKPQLEQTTSNAEDEKEGKLTNAKLNVLRRFMNFFGGAKASKEYEKIKDPSAAIIDVKTGFFDDDNIFESESKLNSVENKETKVKCSSFSVPENNSTAWSTNAVASERNVEKKDSKLLSKSGRKAQTKTKLPRHVHRDKTRDMDSGRTTTAQESPHQPKCLESTQTDIVKKPSAIVSSIFGSKTSYSRTVCKDILKLSFEGDPTSITATDTSHDENDCCICYNPPKCYRNKDVLPKEPLEYFQDDYNETDHSAHTTDYICYARIPENQRAKGNYRYQQPNPPKQQPQHKNMLRSFFKSRNEKKIYSTYSTCSTGDQTPEVLEGKLLPKPKTPMHNQYCLKPQEYEAQLQDSQYTQRPSLIEKPMVCNSKINPPVVRKQNAYLIEKPQVNPDRITRLMPDDKPKVWTGGVRRECFPPSTNNNYNETSDVNSSFSAISKNLESTDVNSSYSGMPTMKTNPFTTSSDINSSVSTVPTTMAMLLPGIKGFHKYKYPSEASTTQNTVSTSSSDFDCPTSYINNTVSNSSRSSYWLPPKRLARDSRELPKLNPSNTFVVKPTFSKEVIKLFQRAPKSSKR